MSISAKTCFIQFLAAVCGTFTVLQTSPLAAAETVLRVCTSRIEAPFSYPDGSGFENKIATAVAQAMGRKVEFIWTDRAAIYLVRDLLDKNECDVVVGLDPNDPRVLTTRPYYRSGYAIVTKADRNLSINAWSSPDLMAMKQVAMGFSSAPEAMFKKIGKYEDNINYIYELIDFKSRRNQYIRIDPGMMVSQVAQGKADAAIAFAPELARYVRDSTVPLNLSFVPPDETGSGETVIFEYNQTMGVRRGDTKLRDALNKAIEKAMPQISAILKQEAVPTLPIDQS
ncbi:MAG: methanol oxidation system protein MoxJ [Parahaliea sp.]